MLLSLESHFSARVSLVESALLASAPAPLDAAAPTLNSLRRELALARRELEEARQEAAELQEETDRTRRARGVMAETAKRIGSVCTGLSECAALPCNQALRSAVGAKEAAEPDRAANNKAKGKAKAPASKAAVQKPQLPSTALVVYPTQQEFENLPKYMKGRLTYDGLNGAIDEFNKAVTAKYNFMLKGFNAMASVKDKTKYKALKALETKDTKGCHFVTAEDLRNCTGLRSEAVKKSFFSILRHLQRTKEVRGPGPVIRYVIIPHA